MTIKKRKNVSEIVTETINQFPSIEVKCRLREILLERGLSARELSLLTGIRYATISEMVNNRKVTISLQHTLAVMVALRVEFNDLFVTDFKDPEDKKRFQEDKAMYDENGVPDEELEKIKQNAYELGREDELKSKYRQ